MNQILLSPTDVLFFRDGRPMGGSLAGHTAAWPLPTVTNAALHAALWRSGLADSAHAHTRKAGVEHASARNERFGSLTTAGPFPVCTNGAAPTWFFPAPADATNKQTGQGTLTEVLRPTPPIPGSASSNPLPLTAASLQPPTKDKPAAWWSEGAWNTYLGTAQRDTLAARLFTKSDTDFADTEAQFGIGIDPERGTQDGTRLYSAHYLRLRDGWRIGLFSATAEKFEEPGRRGERHDLLEHLFSADNTIILGGQQRICTAERQSIANGQRLPLPLGMAGGFATATLTALGDPQPKHLVKWVLLSPAVFPEIRPAEGASDAEGRPLQHHSGGWLPTWISDDNEHRVLLRAPLPARDVKNESRDAYRARVRIQEPIAARLVAAVVPKPIPVTGWSLGSAPESSISDPASPIRPAGAKPTHLAVPAGAVYYFACDSAKDAEALAAALNWHGDSPGTTIRNRRSTLLGEKGFGLGVCGTWTPHGREGTSST
jgi:hypothetical protein